MQHSEKQQTIITLHKDFEECVRILAFLLGYKDATEFLIFLIETADQQTVAKGELKLTHSNKKIFFPEEKGLVEKDSKRIMLRFYASPENRKRLLMLTKMYKFKNYSDFIIAMLVEAVNRHKDEIRAYIHQINLYSKKVQKNEKRINPVPILPSKPKNHDTHRIQVN